MSSVCSSSLLWCLIYLDVLHDQTASVKTFDISVGFGILEESKEKFGGFDWMAGSRDTELFACTKINVSILTLKW